MAVITGNANDNVLRGLSSADSVYGLDGNDTLYGPGQLFGGVGDDNYIFTILGGGIFNTTGTFGRENPNQGYDIINFNIAHPDTAVYLRSKNIEEYIFNIPNGNRTSIGLWSPDTTTDPLTIRINGTQPAIDSLTGLTTDPEGAPVYYDIFAAAGSDTIWGSEYDDHIDGGKGADVLLGSKGDDIYEVDVKSDIVIELGGGGHDRINCTAREYNLQINVEDLYAYGERGSTGLNFNGNVNSNHIEITGDFDHVVKSGAGDDYVSTAGGNDYLIGGTGNDTLVGGLGNDGYRTDIGNFGKDVITDAGGADDSLELMGLNPEQIWFSQVGNDLKIYNIDSPTNNVTVQNWFSDANARLETIYANGKSLESFRLNDLISVMSDFTRPNTSTETVNPVLNQAIQADWR